MVNLSRPFTRGFTVAHLEEAQPEADLPDAGALQKNATSIRGKSIETSSRAQGVEETAVAPPASNMMRRGSKSLPASPMGSPKAVRKNPYFTGIFTSQSNNNGNTEHQRGWLLSSLLGVQRETTSTQSSTTNIAEESEHEAVEYEAYGQTAGGAKAGQEERTTSITSVFRATKPSEIREMNFWSPTSM